MDKKERALQDLYVALCENSGYVHKITIRVATALCLNKVTRQEAAKYLTFMWTTDEEQHVLSEKIYAASETKEGCRFIEKYSKIFQIEDYPISQGWLIETKKKIKNKPKLNKDPEICVPIRDIYWVIKKVLTNAFYKRKLYFKENLRDMALLRKAFIEATKYTQTNHRKKSQKYTVSRDEDRNMFYVSAKGRLAQLPKYKLDKYRKQNIIVEDHGELRATCDISDGQYIKVGSFIQKHMKMLPKETKEALQKAFEEIRPCHMVIDTDFEKAYTPIYNCHQDTDGDKASNYSCMSGDGSCAQQFYGGIHGCKVVRWETDKGDQVGRCIMYEYEGKRHFVRIYGIYDYHRTMINMLQNEMHSGDLFGRDQQIPDMVLDTDWVDETLTMYLDGPYGVRQSYNDEKHCNKYEVTARHWDFDCKSTSHGEIGYEDEEWYTCERCGERVHNDDAYFIHDNAYCCSSCAEDDGWHCCEWCGEWEWEEDGIWVDDVWYCCGEHARKDGYEKCENCGEWHSKSGMIEIGDNYYCDEDCAEEDGWHRCKHCDEWVHEDGAEIVNDEAYCCKECAEEDGWELKDGEWQRAEDEEEAKETEEPKEVVNEN